MRDNLMRYRRRIDELEQFSRLAGSEIIYLTLDDQGEIIFVGRPYPSLEDVENHLNQNSIVLFDDVPRGGSL